LGGINSFCNRDLSGLDFSFNIHCVRRKREERGEGGGVSPKGGKRKGNSGDEKKKKRPNSSVKVQLHRRE